MSGCIFIKGLCVSARLGVSEDERTRPQQLEIDLAMECDFRNLRDDVSFTVDYVAVASWVEAECGKSGFRLLESLAEHLTGGLLAEFSRLQTVEVEIRKFVLPSAKHAGVRLRRERG